MPAMTTTPQSPLSSDPTAAAVDMATDSASSTSPKKAAVPTHSQPISIPMARGVTAPPMLIVPPQSPSAPYSSLRNGSFGNHYLATPASPMVSTGIVPPQSTPVGSLLLGGAAHGQLAMASHLTSALGGLLGMSPASPPAWHGQCPPPSPRSTVTTPGGTPSATAYSLSAHPGTLAPPSPRHCAHAAQAYYSSLTSRATHFDPYPSAPAPTPASSYVDASYLSASLMARQLAANSDAAVTRGGAWVSPPAPAAMPPAVPANTPASPLGPLMGAMQALSTSPMPDHLAAVRPPTSTRPRRRSSLSMATTLHPDGALALSSMHANMGSGNGDNPAAAGGLVRERGGDAEKIYLCDECGKVFRSNSTLAKHAWEHSEHWRAASKLKLPKHQQVQLLEAAKILVNMEAAGASAPATTAAAAAASRRTGHTSGGASSESTIPSSPVATDDEIMFPMQTDECPSPTTATPPAELPSLAA